MDRLFVVESEYMNKGRNIEVSTHESEMFVLSLGGQIGLHPFWGEANLLEPAVPHQERQDGPAHSQADQGCCPSLYLPHSDCYCQWIDALWDNP